MQNFVNYAIVTRNFFHCRGMCLETRKYLPDIYLSYTLRACKFQLKMGLLWGANVRWGKFNKIQQLAHLHSVTYIYVHQDIFIFNILYFNQQCAFSFNFNQNYFHSAKIIVQLQAKLVSVNNNIHSTSTKVSFTQQKYLLNFNQS